jgi:hypothetical protein
MPLYRHVFLDGTVAWAYSPPPVYTNEDKRQIWIAHWKREAKLERQRIRWAGRWPVKPSKPLLWICKDVTCGAKTRAGTPCQRRDISKRNGRCKLHGGASTGPRTNEGKARVADNLGYFAKDSHGDQTP